MAPRNNVFRKNFNQIKQLVAEDNETKTDIAKRFGIPVRTLLDYFAKHPIATQTTEFDPTVTIQRVLTKETTQQEVWDQRKQHTAKKQHEEEAQRYLTLKFNSDKPIALAWIADLHLDDALARLDSAENDAKVIKKTEGMYLGLGGDTANWFLKQLDRFPKFDTPEMATTDKLKLIKYWLDIVKSKWLFLTMGNHDYYLYSRSGMFFERDILGANVHITKDELLLNLHVGTQHYLTYFSHSFFGSSRINPLHEFLRAYRHCPGRIKPDLIGLGHRHDGLACDITMDGEKAVFLKSSSYKPKSADFEGQASIPQSSVEMPCAIFLPTERRIIPVMGVEQTADLLNYLRRKK